MSDIAKGITDCLDTINKLRDENQELRAFEGSDALGAGDFSVCIRGADRIEAQAARIAELEKALRFANEYVGRLALTLAEKHYPEQRFELLPDLLGKINQIDNMTCGLHRAGRRER